jgi:membrane protein YqaA with SNARE-associated domain
VHSGRGQTRRGDERAILASALTSVPPFYAVSLAAGTVRVRFGRFFAAGCAGCLLRFAVVFALPRLFG